MPSQDTPKQNRQKAVFDQAIRAHRLGNLSVMPIGRNKRPSEKWKEWQSRLPNAEEMARNFPATGGPEGIGVITGKVSGNLEMLEFEGRAANLYDEMGDKLPSKLWRKVTVEGYRETTPSGGIHIYYRVEGGDVAGNTKLASRPATPEELEENPHEKTKVLIETRGEGGYSVIAPSGGEVTDARYPGGEWKSTAGALMFIPTITAAERDQLHDTARTFHVEPERPVVVPATPRPRPAPAPGELSPIDDFNARHTGEELIAAAGWTTNGEMRAGRVLWTRPGKNARDGHSATVDPETGNVYVFTTASELPDSRPLDAAGVYAWLNHGGDFSAASRQLRKDGYGTPRPATEPPGNGSRWIDRTDLEPPAGDGNGTDGVVVPIDKKKKARQAKPAIFATDAANAENLIAAHGHEIRYCPHRKEWAIFTGQRWEWNGPEGHAVMQMMLETVRAYDDSTDAMFAWKKKSMNHDKLRAAVNLARSFPAITAPATAFDARPYELNCPNGTVNLRTGELMPHDPAAMHTRMTALEYHPEANRDQLDTYLQETFEGPNRDATITYLQRMAGHSLLGEVREHVLPYLIGAGRNGKSVYIHSTRRALGDYADALTNGFFMKNAKVRDDELAELYGLRYGVCSEVDEKDVFDEARTKTSVGGDAIKGRPLYGKFFTFNPTHHLWLMGNYKPAVESGGTSFWSRLKLIEFPNRRPEHLQDKDLEKKLAADPALLAWMIEGTVDYLKHGLQEPAHISTATKDYAHDEDTLGQFIEERCVTGHPAAVMGAKVKTDDLLAAYKKWGAANGHRIDITKTSLSRKLKADYDVEAKVSNSIRYYSPMLLQDPENDSTERSAERWMDA